MNTTTENIRTDPMPVEGEGNGPDVAPAQTGWRAWLYALRQALPIYLAVHLALLILTYFSALFALPNFSTKSLSASTLYTSWFRWDSGHFTFIATHGYDVWWRTAFFPLYPITEHVVALLTQNAFVAGLLVSNVAGLGMLAVLYRLVLEDFDGETAWRSVLYLSVFPTAFFFAAAYNESLFLLLTLLSFYYMRRGNWWLAGLFGLLSALARSSAVVLFLPFCYEYLRQHDFSLRKIRLSVLACAGIPIGIGAFALYCYFRFHDLLVFSHAQSVWNRSMHGPWHGLIDASLLILKSNLLTFATIHNVIDLGACLFVMALVILCFVGPWKLPASHLVYGIFAALMYLFSLIFPTDNSSVPLGAFSRYLLEVFPAFIILAAIGKNRLANLYYLTISLPIMAFLLLQFLTGHWVI